MTHTSLLLQVAQHLDAVGIPFMIAGSVASSYHSQPRSTNDVDIVIAPTLEQLDRWLALLGDGFYASREMAHDALRSRSMFNVIDLTSGVKVDLILRKERPFSVGEFQRRQVGSIQDRSVPIATPEDMILSKLEWNKITPSERQVRDAQGVAIAQWPTLDHAYLRKWAPQLGVAEDLEEILRTAEAMQTPPGS